MESVQSLIKQVCAEFEDVQFRVEYSGRGMHGRNCIGIVGSHREVKKVIAEVIKQATNNMFSTSIDAESEEELRAAHDENDAVALLIDEILDFDTDSMGHDVILYWSDLEPIEEPDVSDMPYEEWVQAVATACKTSVGTLKKIAEAMQEDLNDLHSEGCPVDDAKDIFIQALR